MESESEDNEQIKKRNDTEKRIYNIQNKIERKSGRGKCIWV